MNRREYCEVVLASMHRLTKKERRAIRMELDGHMEDHMEALLDAGYPEELAEARSTAAMGDPEAVGKELNRQCPVGWLILGRGAMLLTLALALFLARPLAERVPNAWTSLQSRWAPKSVLDISRVREDFDPLGVDAWDMDAETVIQDQHFRVYQVGFREGQALLAVTSWRANPLEEEPDRMDGSARRVLVNGEEAGFSIQPVTGNINLYAVWAGPGDELTFTWEMYGETGGVALELPEEVGS